VVSLPGDGRALLVVDSPDRSLLTIDLESGLLVHTFKAGEPYPPELPAVWTMVVEMPSGPLLLTSAHTGLITIY
jgi:hypothetical protein